MCVNQGTPTSVTYVIQVLQMLEASRNASCFADTIEYAIFAHASLIAFNFFFCLQNFKPDGSCTDEIQIHCDGKRIVT
jgi:hypothetical protein